MKSNLKNMYENQYENYNCTNDSLSTYDCDVDIPTGWSFVCLDETIDYYTDCNSKILSIDINNKN
uniref:Uncharacterized protein n=1 Tax=Bostrychia moritziana TaxID=103713 RepID=A0A1Z1M6B7_BOSMO|nr:hypothetical protein [Bostrychia moritziana]ARW61638.1 hypothetical protein [Bostrychia moritziana]